MLENSASNRPRGWIAGLCALLAAVVLTTLLTRPPDYIDTFNYAKNIVDHGSLPASQDPFWDFGHVLWRPIGKLIWSTFGFVLTKLNDAPEFQIALGLIGLSIASVIVCTTVLYLLLLRVSQTLWIAMLATYAFMVSRFVLDYALTGMAYATGIMLQVASLYVLYSALQESRLTVRRALLSGVLAGASVCVWFPYGFTLTGFLLFALLWSGAKNLPLDTRLRFTALWVAAIAAVLLAAYIPIMQFRGVHSVADFRAWMTASSYGIRPTRGLLRAAVAIPRSFVWMGDAGVLFKRFLFDAAHRWVTAPELINGAWRILLVYGVLATWAWLALRTMLGRTLLWCLALTAAPTMYFAIFLFDPAPPIRYIAFYPLLFLGFAGLMHSDKSAFGRWILPIFCVLIGVLNLTGMSRLGGDAEFGEAPQRLQSLNEHAASGDRILILTLQDKLNQLVYQRPFSPASRNRAALWPVIVTGTDYLQQWQARAAQEMLNTWQSGGRIWLSKRMLAQEPRSDWNWVEGDDYRISWAQIPAYFQAFELSSDFGGEDGFAEIVHSPHNETMLKDTLRSR